MTHNDIPLDATPDWLLQAVRVMRVAGQSTRNIDTELRRAMAFDGVDPRLINEMQNVRDALGTVNVSLSVMDMIANKLIEELAESGLFPLQQADFR